MIEHALRLASDLTALGRSMSFRTFCAYTTGMVRTFPSAVRKKSLGPADAEMANRPCRFRVPGRGTVELPGEYVGLAREIFAKRIYTWPGGFEISAGDSVVDLGANVGVFSLYAAALGADVISVEAQEGFLPLIGELFKRNSVPAPTCVHAVVGSGTGVFGNQANRTQASHWGKQPEELTLDAILDRSGSSKVALVKCDIEGSEFDLVFNSTAGSLGRIQRIAMEVHTAYGDPHALKARLEIQGFDVFLADNWPRPVNRITEPFGFLYATRTPGR